MPKPLRVLTSAGALPAVVALSGCAALGPDSAGAADTARAFHAASANGDGDAACARLSTRLKAELEQSEGRPCPEAVLAADVPQAAAVTSVQVWGGRALVVLDHDAVFVAEFDGGWRVIAAGCSPRTDRPYDCTLKG
jgi:hypothetical protein